MSKKNNKEKEEVRKIAEAMAYNLRVNRKDPDFLEKEQALRDGASRKVRAKTGFKPLRLEDLEDEDIEDEEDNVE